MIDKESINDIIGQIDQQDLLPQNMAELEPETHPEMYSLLKVLRNYQNTLLDIKQKDMSYWGLIELNCLEDGCLFHKQRVINLYKWQTISSAEAQYLLDNLYTIYRDANIHRHLSGKCSEQWAKENIAFFRHATITEY